MAWDPVLRYKKFWLKFLFGTRQGSNFNLITLHPKRSASIEVILFPEAGNSVFANFVFVKGAGTIQAGNFRVSVSLLASFFFTWWSLSAGCQACSLYFTEAKKVNCFFQVHYICLVFLSHDTQTVWKEQYPQQAWAEESPGRQNFWHPLGWT